MCFLSQHKSIRRLEGFIHLFDKFLLPNQTKTLPLQLLDAQCLEIMGWVSALRKERCGVLSVPGAWV